MCMVYDVNDKVVDDSRFFYLVNGFKMDSSDMNRRFIFCSFDSSRFSNDDICDKTRLLYFSFL